ncbi:unnamed protein product, partial [Polarella glacialis]
AGSRALCNWQATDIQAISSPPVRQQKDAGSVCRSAFAASNQGERIPTFGSGSPPGSDAGSAPPGSAELAAPTAMVEPTTVESFRAASKAPPAAMATSRAASNVVLAAATRTCSNNCDSRIGDCSFSSGDRAVSSLLVVASGETSELRSAVAELWQGLASQQTQQQEQVMFVEEALNSTRHQQEAHRRILDAHKDVLTELQGRQASQASGLDDVLRKVKDVSRSSQKAAEAAKDMIKSLTDAAEVRQDRFFQELGSLREELQLMIDSQVERLRQEFES